MDTPTRPRPLTCAGCTQVHDRWVFNPNTVDNTDDCLEAPGWDWDDEWWVDPQDPHDLWSYCCSRFCYVSRKKERIGA